VIGSGWSGKRTLDDPLDDLRVHSADRSLVRRLVLRLGIAGSGRQL